MTLVIRPAQASDAPVLSRVGAQTFAMAYNLDTPRNAIRSYIDTELSPDRVLRHLSDPDRSVFVATMEGVLCGYVMLRRAVHAPQLPARHPLELHRLYAHPAHQHAGVSEGLLRRAILESEQGGHDWLWLGVSGSNGSALRLYKAHGFQAAGRYYFPLGDGVYEGLMMARPTDATVLVA